MNVIVPENSLGIFAMHSYDNKPLPFDKQAKLFNGPLNDIKSDLRKELARLVDEEAWLGH